MQRTPISFKSGFGALEANGGFLTEVCYLDLDLICSLVFDTPMVLILDLNFEFEGAKNIHVIQVLIWGSGRCWRFLTVVCHFDLDLDMVTGL